MVKDALGREMVVPASPGRIVSLTPGVTEMLFAIGLDKQIVGVTRYCNYPPQAKTRVKVGGYYDPSLEKIVALQPDLVVMSADGYSQPVVDKLIQMNIACFVVKPRKVAEIVETMQVLANITGMEKQAKPLLVGFAQRLVAIEEAVAAIPGEQRKRVFYALGARDLWTTGGNTFVHDLIERSGTVNIAARSDKNWYQFSPETLIVANPDFILTGRGVDQKHRDVLEEWELRKALPAIAQGRLCTVDNDSLSRPGPRAFGVLEQLVQAFYLIELNTRRTDQETLQDD